MRQEQDGFTLAELLVVITIIGLLAALVLPSIIDVLFQGNMVVCQNNLKQVYESGIQDYRASNQSAPPPLGGSSDAENWGMFLKDNGQGSGDLKNELFFCPITDRTGDFDEEAFAEDDGDYMFNVSKSGLSPLSSGADPDTLLMADCVARNKKASSHGDPSKNQVNILMKDSSIQKAKKGDEQFDKVMEANMIGGDSTNNTACPPPTAYKDTQESPSNEKENPSSGSDSSQ